MTAKMFTVFCFVVVSLMCGWYTIGIFVIHHTEKRWDRDCIFSVIIMFLIVVSFILKLLDI
jgi:hypothetical protein